MAPLGRPRLPRWLGPNGPGQRFGEQELFASSGKLGDVKSREDVTYPGHGITETWKKKVLKDILYIGYKSRWIEKIGLEVVDVIVFLIHNEIAYFISFYNTCNFTYRKLHI